VLPATAAIDRTTGEFQWTYCSAELAWREVRGATDDIVYVDTTMPDPSASASEYRRLNAVIALDARSGAELWRVAVARQQLGWPPGPFTGSGVVVVQVDDEAEAAIVGVDADTGETRWRVTEAELDATIATNTNTSLPPVSPSPSPASVVAPLRSAPCRRRWVDDAPRSECCRRRPTLAQHARRHT
jgi:outer membrane protein assembly factor BamB